MTAALHIPYDNFRRDHDKILYARESQTRAKRANSFKPKGCVKGRKREKRRKKEKNIQKTRNAENLERHQK